MDNPCEGCWKESSHIDCDSCLPYHDGCRFYFEPYSADHPYTPPVQYPRGTLKLPKKLKR